MPNTKNQAVLTTLQEKAARAKSVVLTTYTGLSVAQQTQLQRELREAGGELTIAKNTLIKLALGLEDLGKHLTNQTAILFSYADEVAPLKKLTEFIKKAEKPEIKAGMIEGRLLTAAEVANLAKLPAKIDLIGMVMNRLQGPAYGLVNVVQGPMRNLVYALDAIRTKQESAQ